MKWDRAVSNYKKHCIVVSHTHLISDNFLSLQTPFAIALMAMAGEGSYEVGVRGGCKLTAYHRPPNTVMNTRNGWLSKVVYPASKLSNRLFNYAFGKPFPKPALSPSARFFSIPRVPLFP